VNYRFILKQLALLQLVFSASVLAVTIFSGVELLVGRDDEHAALIALIATVSTSAAIGGVSFWVTRDAKGYLDRREALLLVALSWILGAVLAALPYYLWALRLDEHVFHSPVACYFEAMSGLTTTGATVLSDIEALPRSLLLWRSITHWLGGLGIVVLFVAVLPSLGVGGRKLFRVETAGPTPGGVHPHIRETARALWYIYAGLTLAAVLALVLAGMDLFDAVCHAMSTLATGGFSTRNASIAAYTSDIVRIILIVFMVMAGVNFGLYHQLIKRRWREVIRDPELRTYFIILGASSAIIAIWLYARPITMLGGEQIESAGAWDAARSATFTAVSIQTTTGFCTADFDLWALPVQSVLVLLMFMGGCAGSTAGGIKVIRIWIALKVMLAEIERVFRPYVVRPVRISGRTIDNELKLTTLAYVLGIIVLFVLGAGAIMLLEEGVDFATAATASVASLCTIGPGLSQVGATQNYGWMGAPSLGVLSVLMLIGRLEIFAILVLLTPTFWRSD
jgi:trk system potassium uptake protein TrkH